jgi:alginate O-acetyltransferase complex protein AlgI
MLFNSLNFAIFLPIVFVLYWFCTGRQVRRQNILLLVASYFFYGFWDYRFLFLLIFSTFLDYGTGLKMSAAATLQGRRFWFWLSVIVNVGFLAVFKYYNFFATSFAELLSHFGLKPDVWTLRIILPVGISFYTFHGLSYVIDIYKGRIKPEKNFVDYSVFVSFFPLLVAGPIERATHLLPQIKQKREFRYSHATRGLKQILWGLFKKVVIADNCAIFVNTIFEKYAILNGSTLILGAVFFAIQIYCDFSGYSDIALGTAELFGINLLRNFAYPYFSRDIAEFWRRWHISLSSWFRDYLYIPLGGSRGATWLVVRNVLIIFLVSGFWHGANWTFIIWGFLNALYILPSVLSKTNRNNLDIVATGRVLPTLRELLSMLLTFFLTVLAWIFFRAPTVTDAMQYLRRIFSRSGLRPPNGNAFLGPGASIYQMVLLLVFFFLMEWRGREQHFAIARFGEKRPIALRWVFYVVLILFIYYFTSEQEQQFIYFQF